MVEIEMEGFPKPEIIINPAENFEEKLRYYQKAYTDDLVLKTFNGIRIKDFAPVDDLTVIKANSF